MDKTYIIWAVVLAYAMLRIGINRGKQALHDEKDNEFDSPDEGT